MFSHGIVRSGVAGGVTDTVHMIFLYLMIMPYLSIVLLTRPSRGEGVAMAGHL